MRVLLKVQNAFLYIYTKYFRLFKNEVRKATAAALYILKTPNPLPSALAPSQVVDVP